MCSFPSYIFSKFTCLKFMKKLNIYPFFHFHCFPSAHAVHWCSWIVLCLCWFYVLTFFFSHRMWFISEHKNKGSCWCCFIVFFPVISSPLRYVCSDPDHIPTEINYNHFHWLLSELDWIHWKEMLKFTVKYPKNFYKEILFSCLGMATLFGMHWYRKKSWNFPLFSPFSLKSHWQHILLSIFTKLRQIFFKLIEKIKILGSLLVCCLCSMFLNPLILGQSKVLFHGLGLGFFPVFFYLNSVPVTEIFVPVVCLNIICILHTLSPLFLGIQLNCSYSICTQNAIIKNSGLSFTLIALYCTPFVTELHYFL